MNTVNYSKSKSPSGQVKTLQEYLSEIKEQVSFYEFEGTDDEAQAEELCKVMAKVMRLPDNFEISIGGKNMDAAIVKETFEDIRYTHICHVIEKFSKVNHHINCLTSYLRTALFNSTDEAEHSIVNEVNGWMK